ncbi:MAG TPA: ABC transporter substrate-binding protein [Dongiaceae bacterium]|nr:ABC transporter substrate-binding protein [Dongiaceae bacterium]
MRYLLHRIVLVAIIWAGLWRVAVAADLTVVRLGLLQFGTVNWEVTVMRDGLDRQHGIRIEPVMLADKDAAAIALLSGQVDAIVTDWLWVARQRAGGKDFTFVPFSMAAGGVMARPEANLSNVADLAGRRIGVGGGPDDKSWLLLRAYAQKSAGLDLVSKADIQFSAPPVLNEMIQRGKLDAVLNFWQFNAQLQAKGYREIISTREMLTTLGIDRPPPLLGWVFHEQWADKQPQAAKALLETSFDAKKRLLQDDAVWQQLRPSMNASDDRLFEALKSGYRAGIPTGYDSADVEAARKTLSIMNAVDPAATAGLADLPVGTLWSGYRR